MAKKTRKKQVFIFLKIARHFYESQILLIKVVLYNILPYKELGL